MALFSKHQLAVIQFMLRAKQPAPATPSIPDGKHRILGARIMLEEVMETILDGMAITLLNKHTREPIEFADIEFQIQDGVRPNLVELIDGCCDTRYVATWVLCSWGIPDEQFQEEVDHNNILKFGPGHSWDDNGKLIKPPQHRPPQIEEILTEMFVFSDEEKIAFGIPVV